MLRIPTKGSPIDDINVGYEPHMGVLTGRIIG